MTSKPRIIIDWSRIKADCSAMALRVDSVITTMSNGGEGQVLVSQRKKAAWEKKKPQHGRVIANYLMTKGKTDPFVYTPAARAEADAFIEAEAQAAIEDAWKTGRPQLDRVKRLLIAAADYLAESVRDFIIGGGLGGNTVQSGRRKKRWAELGRTGRFGSAPPWGILTGRFVEGIRGRWVSGKSRRARG